MKPLTQLLSNYGKTLIFSTSLMLFTLTAQAEDLDRIVAIVNKHIITENMLNQKIAFMKNKMTAQHAALPSDSQMRQQTLNMMIETNLLLDDAAKQGVVVTDADIQDQMKSIAAQNHISLNQLKQSIKKQGLSLDEYQHQMKNQMTIARLQQKVIRPNIKISPEEVKSSGALAAQINNNNASAFHLEAVILQPPKVLSAELVTQIKSKVNEIASKLQSNEDPKTIALVESSDTITVKGGDMGWRQAEQLPPPLVAKMNQSKKGAVMPPFQTPEGIYIVKLVDKKKLAAASVPSEEYHLRHILVHVDEFTSPTLAKEKLNEIRTQLEKGASFAEMAEKYSQETDSAAKGGDMGWVKTEDLPTVFTDTLAKLKLNEISQPFQTSDGMELVQVLAIRKQSDSKSMMNEQIKQALYQQKLSEATSRYVNGLKGSAYIKIMHS